MKILYAFICGISLTLSPMAQALLKNLPRKPLLTFDEYIERCDSVVKTLMIAIIENDISKVEKLIQELPLLINGLFRDITPLLAAAQKGYAYCLQKLIDAGANLNIQTDDGATPLFIAAQEGHAYCLQILIDAGANLNIQANDGATPLHIAAYKGHADCVSLLRAFGADPYQTDKLGDNAFDYAGQSTNSVEICTRLQETTEQARERIAYQATGTRSLFYFVKDRELGLKRHTIKRSLS